MLATAVSVLAAVVGASAIVVPPPSGPYSVKSEVHDLTDESRWDPYAPANATHKRRVLASTFLPLESCDEEIVTPYLPPATEAVYMQLLASFGLPEDLISGFEVGYCSAGAALEQGEGSPLIVITPGFTGTRLGHGVLARELASLGYAVVTIDHPYDATVVEFPDGTVSYGPVMSEEPAELIKAVDVRTQDISFVIDQLADSDFPIDLSKIIAVGHSMGGWGSAAVSLTDDRILAGMDLDGLLRGPVVETGLSKPFILVGTAEAIEKGGQDGWRTFYDNSNGIKMMLGVNETTHQSFFDPVYVLSLKEIPAEVLPVLQAVLGPIDGKVMADISRELVVGLADLAFEGDASTLKGIDEKFEQVAIAEQSFPDC